MKSYYEESYFFNVIEESKAKFIMYSFFFSKLSILEFSFLSEPKRTCLYAYFLMEFRRSKVRVKPGGVLLNSFCVRTSKRCSLKSSVDRKRWSVVRDSLPKYAATYLYC